MIKNSSRILVLVFIIILLTLPTGAAKNKKINLRGFDKFVNKIIKEWEVPGVAVAVVKDGKTVYARGFGFRDVSKKLPVTADTLFAIGSCSKAFTATALGIMVDKGKLEWDKPVRDYMPGFKLQDPVATEGITAVDLMCHRSGLPRHDYVWYGSTFTRQDLFDRLQYLEPTKGFREAFQYNNLMFLTAGLLLEELSSMSWEKFIQKNILDPLGMKNSNFSVENSKKAADFSLPYSKRDKKVVAIPFRNIDTMGPAGSINSSVNEMAQWLKLNLNKGKIGEKEIIKKVNLKMIHSPKIVAGGLPQSKEMFYGMYALGWGVTSYRGELLVTHGGGIDGFISSVSFMPRHEYGFVILTNSDRGGSSVATILANNLYDRVLGQKQIGWNKILSDREKKKREAAEKTKKDDKQVKGTKPSHEINDYLGRYENPGYGIFKVVAEGKGFKVIADTIILKATHYHYDIFKLKSKEFGDQSLLAAFHYDADGRINKISIALQSGVKDIEFKRMPDDKMKSKKFLSQFLGKYQFTDSTATITLKGGNILILTVPNQPQYELVPIEGTTFAIKIAKGYTVEFVLDKTGKVTGLKTHQPNGSFLAKKVE